MARKILLEVRTTGFSEEMDGDWVDWDQLIINIKFDAWRAKDLFVKCK